MKTIAEGAKDVSKVLAQFKKICDAAGHPLRGVTLRIGDNGKDKVRFTYKRKAKTNVK